MCKCAEIITFDMLKLFQILLYWNASAHLTVIDLMNADDDEIPQELLLGKHQLSELSSESAKIKAMGIMHKVGTPLSTGDIGTRLKRQDTSIPDLLMLTAFILRFPLVRW